MCWMNFVPVCARILWVLAAELAIFLLLWLLYGLDEELRIYTRRSWLMLGSVLTAICAFCMYPTKAEAARQTEMCMIYNEAWGNAKKGVPLACGEAIDVDCMQSNFDARD